MELIHLIITFVLFFVLLYGIKKKVNLATLLFCLSVIALFYLTLTSGSPLLSKVSTGNRFFDIFEYMYEQMQSTLSGTILTVILIYGYLDVMNRIKAADMLASVAIIPFSAIKDPHFMASLAIIIGAVLKIGVTVGPTIAMLMVATVYPILLAAGCSRQTAASAMFTYSIITWGPADTACYTGLALMRIENISVAAWFVQMQLPVSILCILAVSIIFYFTSRYFDQKDSVDYLEHSVTNDRGYLNDTPLIFAVLPLLPLIFVLVFSELFWKSITISVVAAVLISMIIAMVAYSIHKKSILAGMNLFGDMCNGAGGSLKGLGMIIMFGTIFAGILNLIGGMNTIISALSVFHINPSVLVYIVCMLVFIISLVIGTFFGSISMCIPLAASLAEAAGMNPLAILQLVLMACGAGVCCSPIQSAVIAISQACKIDATVLIKRNVIPSIAGLLISITITLLCFC